MGKDADCCDACRLFGGEPQAAPPPEPATPIAQRDRIKLVIVDRGETHEYLPTGDTVTIGRGSQNDIAIHDGALSRRQCTIFFRDDQLLIVDTKSTCGTIVDGRKIFAPTPLREGSSVYFGNSVLRVVAR